MRMSAKEILFIRYRLAVRIAVFSLSFLLSLICVDVVIRPFLAKRLYLRPTPMFRKPWPTDENLFRYDPNVRFSGTISGDLSLILEDPKYRFQRHVLFRSDELGFRNYPRKRKQKNKILVLGDSFGAGSGGSQEDMLSTILEQRFSLTSYNLSVGGAGPWAEFMTLKHEISKITLADDGVVLWLLFAGNDLDDFVGDYFELRSNGVFRRWVIEFKTFRMRSPIIRMIRGKADRRNQVAIEFIDDQEILLYRPYIERAKRTKTEVTKHRNIEKFRAIFDEMSSLCITNHLRLFIVLVPSKPETYSWAFSKQKSHNVDGQGDGFSEVIRDWCILENIPFLDLSPRFSNFAELEWQRNRSLLFWPDDTHWNDLGQRFAAKIISDEMKGLNPSACEVRSPDLTAGSIGGREP